ncbi:hypothetical protein [Weissella confusa]|uniref:hypothetical protein n=1 Tax=Weissella confusa TaxID=1583 RepID=UPI002E1E40E4|nr:hypothetical protein [Weissella confusa]
MNAKIAKLGIALTLSASTFFISFTQSWGDITPETTGVIGRIIFAISVAVIIFFWQKVSRNVIKWEVLFAIFVGSVSTLGAGLTPVGSLDLGASKLFVTFIVTSSMAASGFSIGYTNLFKRFFTKSTVAIPRWWQTFLLIVFF